VIHVRTAGLLTTLLLALPALAEENAKPPQYRVGDSLAGVELTTLDGKPAKVSAYAGKTVALVFLASFSRTAREVAQEVEKRLKPKLPENAVVAYVHVESPVAAATFRKEQALTGDSLLDPRADLLTKLGHKSVPAVVVLDGKSVVQFSEVSFSRAKLEAKIRQTAGDDEAQ
jgi:peroxiredoxin